MRNHLVRDRPPGHAEPTRFDFIKSPEIATMSKDRHSRITQDD